MKSHPNRLMSSLSILILLLFPNIAYTQSENENSNCDKIDLQLLQISFINETALYYHFPLNGNFSLRSGISVFWNYEEKKDGEGYSRDFDGPSYNREQKTTDMGINNNYEIILSSQLLYNLNEYKYAKVYLGVGPSLIYSLMKYASNASYYTDTTFSRYGDELEATTLGIGPSISILIKTHLYSSISLVSEYNFSAFYIWVKENSRSRTESKYSDTYQYSRNYEANRESSGWKLRFSNVRVGLLIAL
jgi:hypothetical protein